METIDSILADWQSCRPEGATVSVRQLHEVAGRAAARIRNTAAPEAARQEAYELLQPTWAGEEPEPSLFVRMLRLGASGDHEHVHFLRFWQAMQEVFRRLEQPHGKAGGEPLAEEAAALRDALLRRYDNPSELSCVWFAAEAAQARVMSADEAAWASLEEAIARLRAVPGQAAPGRKGCRGGGAALRFEEASELLFAWLQRAAQDYCRGERRAKIRAVCDVAGCGVREACFHLGCRGWEVEAALLSFYGGVAVAFGTAALGGTCGWSSYGAKLRKSEVECPICFEPYSGEAKPIETGCCFQVLCSACRARLMHPGGFHCPFCRSVEAFRLAGGGH